jgi:hypothetical protein
MGTSPSFSRPEPWLPQAPEPTGEFGFGQEYAAPTDGAGHRDEQRADFSTARSDDGEAIPAPPTSATIDNDDFDPYDFMG